MAGKVVNWLKLCGYMSTWWSFSRDAVLCRVQVIDMHSENAELCLAAQAFGIRTCYAQLSTSPPAGGRAVEPHRSRVCSGVTQFWVQILVPPPTSCVIVEKVFYLSAAFNVIMCKTVNGNSYLKGLLGR